MNNYFGRFIISQIQPLRIWWRGFGKEEMMRRVGEGGFNVCSTILFEKRLKVSFVSAINNDLYL